MQHLKFIKASKSYDENAIIQEYMAKKLLSILTNENFNGIFEFGCGTGKFSKKIISKLKFKTLILNDINAYNLAFDDKRVEFKQFDMNFIENEDVFLKKFDLITSNACMQWLDIKKLIYNLKEMLKDEAFLLLSSFTKDNLWQIKESTGFSLQYLSLNEIKKLFETDFEILHLSDEELTIEFDCVLDIFRHLKLSGVNSLGKFFISKTFLKEYEKKFGTNLSYKPLFLLCKNKNLPRV
ncbi:methyltransferase domain-containing protein [uncultured Campylobacter sp.]|uniref:methyltransferase n=1 Tax=uncultured Campylobacter sp. TaxID=218934 RepID=UPI00260A5856|nr:methyltransferase domain-containing protein [uncultured Campylobacter sp.]